MKKVLALILALALCLGMLAGCQGETQPTENPDPGTETSQPGTPDGDEGDEAGEVAVDEWVIPVLSARTGAVSYVGEPAIWAAEYAAQIINEQGGIRGVPVRVEAYDTEFSGEVGAQIVSGLVDDSLFIVGCMAAPVSLAISTIVADAKVPNVGSYSYQEIRDENAPYLSGYMSDSEMGDLAAATEWINEYGYKKIVLFYTPSDTSQAATKKLFDEQLTEATGAEVVGTVEVETGTVDCGPAAVQALGYDADAYFVCMRADEAGKVINELRSRGVDDPATISATFAGFGSTLLDICGDNAEGIYIWNKLDPNYDSDEWRALVEAYTEEFGEGPSAPPVTGYYNTLIAFKQCVEELGITGDPEKLQEERDAIANWFYNSPEIDGIQGTFSWVNGAMMTDPLMFRVENGEYVAVD